MTLARPILLHHLTRNRLSATWAIVGAMMRSSLPDVSGIPEVRYPHFSKPWFSYIPQGGTEQTHPEWFGASLVEKIRSATPEQEIGFHSFSHVPFGVRGMTRERAIAEYQHCAQLAQELRIQKSSFVFPRNSIGYLRSFETRVSPASETWTNCRSDFRTVCSTPWP